MHSSLRNVIERCFEVLKARFPILKMMSNYPVRKQRRIPIACCVLHNFIRMHTTTNRMFNEYSIEDLIVLDEESTEARQEVSNIDMSQANVSQMEIIRDDIVGAMWLNFIQHNV